VGSISGAAGQWSYNMYQKRKERIASSSHIKTESSLIDRMLTSPYSPVRKISDEDWEKMIDDKVLKVDVEIALIDDQIAALRQEQREKDAETPDSKPSPS
jgi:hypothetical protein